MSNRWIGRGLIAAMLLQVGVLAAEYLNSVYPLWTGQEIRLRTIPVDPRSLFRGNYTRLSYEISEVNLPKDIDTAAPRRSERIYVKLKKGEDGVYGYDGATFKRPATGLWIRGRIRTSRWGQAKPPYRVHYGIEAFFAPKEKALQLEQKLRKGGIAVVMLADNGKAALKEVVEKETE